MIEHLLARIWEHLAARPGGQYNFRFLLQPAMAIVLGVIDGRRFAREGRSFLLWGGPEDPAERRAQARATIRAIGKVALLALILDALYQYSAHGGFYPGEAVIVVFVVALIPYFMVRFFVNIFTRPH